MGKGEMLVYKQFLSFPQYFQKTFSTAHKKQGLIWEWDKAPFMNIFAFVVAILDQDLAAQNVKSDV